MVRTRQPLHGEPLYSLGREGSQTVSCERSLPDTPTSLGVLKKSLDCRCPGATKEATEPVRRTLGRNAGAIRGRSQLMSKS